jgi:hypothetical protein
MMYGYGHPHNLMTGLGNDNDDDVDDDDNNNDGYEKQLIDNKLHIMIMFYHSFYL